MIIIAICVGMGILVRGNIYSSSTVFSVLEYQLGGMVLGAILGWPLSSLLVKSASNKSIRLRKRQATEEEKARWYLSYPFMLAWQIGIFAFLASSGLMRVLFDIAEIQQ